MKNIQILDCTLRDGLRAVNCTVMNSDIEAICNKLYEANIDIVEVGFLRDKILYSGDSTLFTDVDQLRPFIVKNQTNTKFVAFIDYSMFDFSTLKPYDGKTICGIRVGFVKKDLENCREDLIKCFEIVKKQGYLLFIQGVDSLGYTHEELLDIINIVNKIKPFSFGIVDTYGAMYIDDLRRLYNLVNLNLDTDISIDFHSHNNFQLSFSLAQEIIKLSRGIRNIIIDTTLNGIGKGAGNLATELIIDFLVRKIGYNYDFEAILDIIDDYIYKFKNKCSWGYSVPFMIAGIYRSHPNNIIYLLEKKHFFTKDIKNIISMIDSDRRKRYDYRYIMELYTQYYNTKLDDS